MKSGAALKRSPPVNVRRALFALNAVVGAVPGILSWTGLVSPGVDEPAALAVPSLLMLGNAAVRRTRRELRVRKHGIGGMIRMQTAQCDLGD